MTGQGKGKSLIAVLFSKEDDDIISISNKAGDSVDFEKLYAFFHNEKLYCVLRPLVGASAHRLKNYFVFELVGSTELKPVNDSQLTVMVLEQYNKAYIPLDDDFDDNDIAEDEYCDDFEDDEDNDDESCADDDFEDEEEEIPPSEDYCRKTILSILQADDGKSKLRMDAIRACAEEGRLSSFLIADRLGIDSERANRLWRFIKDQGLAYWDSCRSQYVMGVNEDLLFECYCQYNEYKEKLCPLAVNNGKNNKYNLNDKDAIRLNNIVLRLKKILFTRQFNFEDEDEFDDVCEQALNDIVKTDPTLTRQEAMTISHKLVDYARLYGSKCGGKLKVLARIENEFEKASENEFYLFKLTIFVN